MNIAIVVRQLGRLLFMFVLLLLGHAAFATARWGMGHAGEQAATKAFLTAAGIAAVLGGVAFLVGRGSQRDIGRREACLLVVLCWFVGALVAAIPTKPISQK